MAAVPVLVIVLLYSPFVLSGVTIGNICDPPDCPSVKSYSMFGLFSAPYANLNEEGTTIGYFLNYPNQSDDTSSSCNNLSPPPPPQVPLLNASGFIILLDNYSHCMLERILLARAVGFDAVLSYTVDDTNVSITEPIINTGIPIALIQYRYVNSIKNLTFTNYPYNRVTVDGSILSGAIVITTIFVSFVSCFCCICTLCCLCCKIYRDNRDPSFEPLLREDGSRYRSRQELIESILNHLQQMEDELGAQTPLGQNEVDKFPKREYSGDGTERDTTCCVCVDDFKPGQEVRQLPCQHIFHPSCIDKWLSDHSSVCPLCKMDLREANRPTNGPTNGPTSGPLRHFQQRQTERAAARNTRERDRNLTDYSSSDNSVDTRRAQSSIPA